MLGIEFTFAPQAIHLGQQLSIDQILERFGMSNCKSVSTPIDHALKLESTPKGTPSFEQNLYQQMIGALLYLVTCTRLDLAFIISFLSQFSSRLVRIKLYYACYNARVTV